MDEQSEGDKIVAGGAGCLLALWQIVVVLPLWYATLFGVLLTVSPPTWCGCAFGFTPRSDCSARCSRK